MGFKHTGLFPEQAVNWDFLRNKIKNSGRNIKVLNLFAYTGGATVACLSAGASVTHVDSSKGMVEWCKENVIDSGYKEANIRYLVDDCIKFVKREIRHAIEVSWSRGDYQLMDKYFGNSIDYDKSKPTNAEFIITLTDRLRLDNKVVMI